MKYDLIIKDNMKEEYARQIVKWNYEKEYSIYNLPSYEKCKELGYGITKEEQQNNYLVYLIDNEVVFYLNMKPTNGKIFVGFGLKPKYCGQGYGNFFLKDGISEIRKKYPHSILFLEVRSWNKRAIKAYEKIGFKVKNVVMSKDRFGNDIEITNMEI